MVGSRWLAAAVTVSMFATLSTVACSSDSSSEPPLTTTRVASTTLPTTGGRAVPTLAPDAPASTPSAPPPEEPTATPAPTVADPVTTATEPIVRVAPSAPTAQPIQPTQLPRPTPRVPVTARPSITSVTSPVNRGSPALVTATASPGISCSIRVTVPGGVVASANGLGSKLTDGSGKISWSWVVGPATPLGTGQVAVRCGSSEEATSALIIR